MTFKNLFSIFIFLLTFTFGCSSSNQKDANSKKIERPELKNYDQPLSKLISSEDKIKIHISKKDYILTIKKGEQVVKQYPVVFGKNAIDDKRMEGDYCTPEGHFNMRDKYPHRRWNKFIWINYPTQKSYENFEQAKANGEIPKDATVGSEVGIHGVPEGKDHWIDEFNNWTWGCISLKNKDVNEIYPYVNKYTPIIIVAK